LAGVVDNLNWDIGSLVTPYQSLDQSINEINTNRSSNSSSSSERHGMVACTVAHSFHVVVHHAEEGNSDYRV